MIVVRCPACQTQFNVDPALLGSGRRKVRCAKCAHVWRVGQDGKSPQSGQFGLRVPSPAAAESAAPEPVAEAEAGTDIPPAVDTPGETEPPGTQDSGAAAEKPSLWARELIKREKERAELAAASPEAGEGPIQDAQEGEATDAEVSDPSTAADRTAGGAHEDAAGRESHEATRQTGGKRFRIFLILLFLAVLALLAAALLTGRLGPGGIAPVPQAPSTGDVTPPVLPEAQ